MAGNCDSGYSCVYSSTMAWRSATQPLPKEVNPKLVFERLFGAGAGADRAKRDKLRQSVLDFVREDTRDLTGKLGKSDQRKLDEYFSSIRDIEQRIERSASLPEVKTPDYPGADRHSWRFPGAYSSDVRPDGAGVPDRYDPRLHIRAWRTKAATSRTRSSACPKGITNCRITATTRRRKKRFATSTSSTSRNWRICCRS